MKRIISVFVLIAFAALAASPQTVLPAEAATVKKVVKKKTTQRVKTNFMQKPLVTSDPYLLGCPGGWVIKVREDRYECWRGFGFDDR